MRMVKNPETTRQLRYVRALLDGDDAAAFAVAEEMLLARRTLADIYLRLITPALTTVGRLWCDGEIGVGLERLASHLALKHMGRLCGSFPVEEQQVPLRALICCIQGEHQCIGARMAADLFLAKGWSVDFLGADVPTPSLLETVR
ncbi:MAG TPA: B12-binding domain-containing protein, partial [Candidatus Limnocylindria bacterium]|nr:B12-binding domain-containing protein [Candidatus Limnocylindria bacterium]